MVRQNAVTRAHGSCSLRLLGFCIYPILSWRKGLGISEMVINVLFKLLLCSFYNNTRLNSLLTVPLFADFPSVLFSLQYFFAL